MLKRFRSSNFSSMMESSVPKRQRTIDLMLDTAGSGTKEVEVREENQMMKAADVMEPAPSPELGPQLMETIRKVREAVSHVRSFRNADFKSL